ncbi:MAG: ABC transporter permease [Bacteroidia bacterium]|jgi:putative ABC transport system permease protein
MLNTLRIQINQLNESVFFAFRALVQNKVRATLSTLGITIGIFCIIMVLTLVDSLERNVQNSVESLGKDVVFVDKWPWLFTDDYQWWKYMNRPSPKLDELKRIQENSTLAEASAMIVTLGNTTLKYESNSAERVSVQAVSHDYFMIKTLDFSHGRYFTEAESNHGNEVCVLGEAVAGSLFPDINPIERSLTIRGRKYKVVGILKKEGESLLGPSMDNQVIVPVKSVGGYIRLHSQRMNAQIQVKAKPTATVDQVEEELRGIMRAKRRLRPGQEENFALNKITLIAEPIKQLFSVVTFAGWIIGGFAMIVGGFGIANIMFVSVKERTNQIGIQKALGAKNYFILTEFLFESVLLCIGGGIIGLLMVAGLAYMATNLLDFAIHLSWYNMFTGVMVSVIIGIVSGFIPAFTASRLNPIDAIRSK